MYFSRFSFFNNYINFSRFLILIKKYKFKEILGFYKNTKLKCYSTLCNFYCALRAILYD